MCIQPPGDVKLPVKKCGGLQWTCRQKCQFIPAFETPNASDLASGFFYKGDLVSQFASQLASPPITMRFTWDWIDLGEIHTAYGDAEDKDAYTLDADRPAVPYSDYPFLLDILSSNKCDIADSFTTSVSYADIAPEVTGEIFSANNLLAYKRYYYPRHSQPSGSGAGITDFDEVVINDANRSYTQDAFFAFWNSLDTNSLVVHNAMYQRYTGVNASSPDRYTNRVLYRQKVFEYNDTAPLVLALEFDTNDTYLRRLGPGGETLRSFLRIKTRRNISFEKGDSGCYEAMLDSWGRNYQLHRQPFHAGQNIKFYREGSQHDTGHILCPLNEQDKHYLYYNSIFDSKNPNNTDAWDRDAYSGEAFLRSRFSKVNLLPHNKFFFLSDCDSLTLTPTIIGDHDLFHPHQTCVPSEYCTEQLVTTANLPLLNNFVSAAKSDHALADGKILKLVPMSYDDLYGLYIGLLAGAVGSGVTLFASIMGLLLIEIYNVHRSRLSMSNRSSNGV